MALLVDNPPHTDPVEAGKTTGESAPKRKLHGTHESEHSRSLGNTGGRVITGLVRSFAD